VKQVEARQGRVDLVNNASILSGRKPWHSISKEEMNRFVQINFMGYFWLPKQCTLSSRRARRRAWSRTYFLANPGQMAYVASKGAVLGFTRVLAKELGEAALIAFLASDDAEMITGQTILCDGGGYLI
jgi:NAD(P)-dependent dehydrogenase (short-subunit alcohol dehydrogenase family)